LSYDQNKLEILLKWYKQEVGKALIATLVVKNDGLIIEKLTRYTIQEENKRLIDSINEIIKLIIERIELDFRLGSFGAGTFDTAKYRFIFCKAGPDHALITVLNPLSYVDTIIPYSYLTAEKVARIFDGRTVSPVIPKIITTQEPEKIQRKIGSFQKIRVPSAEYAYKVILVGDGAVGKTSMVHRFVEGSFQSDYKATIGTSIMKKECRFEGLESKVRMIIWDLAGQEQFMRVRQMYLSNAEAGFIVYDVTRRETFEHIKHWKKELDTAHLKGISLILVGNKIDLKEQREVTEFEGRNLAEELKISYIETSAKTGDNIEEAFRVLALQMIKGHFATEEFEVFKRAPLPKPKALENVERIKEKYKEVLPLNEYNWIQRKRHKFWNSLIKKIKETSVKTPVFKEGLVFTYIIADNWGGVALNLCHENSEINKKRYKILESYRYDIQTQLSRFAWSITEKLEWDFKEDRQVQRVLLRFKDFGLNDEAHWDKLQYKIIDGMKGLVKCIEDFITNLYPNL